MNQNKSENTPIETLERLAKQVDSDRQVAYIAMITLGGIYEAGHPKVPADLAKAFEWYEKAAHLDGPEAYLGISRLCRLVCINTALDQVEMKMEYADYATTTCNPNTLTRFGWPEIALNVGVTCRYLAEFLTEIYPANLKEIASYYSAAAEFFALAATMDDKHGNDAPALSAKAMAELEALGYVASRPTKPPEIPKQNIPQA